MKVLIVTGGYPSRDSVSGVFVHQQVLALKKAGIDIAVLEIDLRSFRRFRKLGFYRDCFEDITVYRFAIPVGPIPKLTKKIGSMAAAYALKRVCHEFGEPNVIHTHFWNTAEWLVELKSKYSAPIIVTEHSSSIAGGNIERKIATAIGDSYKKCDAIIAVSHILKTQILKITGVESNIIPNILNNSFALNKTNKNTDFSFISIGNLIKRKRFDLTISAFARFLLKHSRSRLTIIGSGVEQFKLQKLVSEYQIMDKVDFLGTVPNCELPSIYAKHHVFVLPSMGESFGVVYAEAAACGLPIIATDCGGPSDIVNEFNGCIVPLDDVEALTEAMIYIHDNYEKYDQEKISTDTTSKFGEQVIVDKLVALYEELLRNRP